jgi:molybdopterin-guanine dinucleotide biosynthesis protein A
VDRIQPEVDRLAISGEPRPGFTLPVVLDDWPGAGPLAAVCSGLAWATRKEFALVMTVSCDTPFIPGGIVARLRAALADHDCAVASCGGVLHPTCAIWKVDCRLKIEIAVRSGVRSLRDMISRLDAIAVDFPAAGGPDGDPFFNINFGRNMIVAQNWLTAAY